MQRRPFVLALGAAGLAPLAARAHHGWSSFDQDRPVYLEGRAERVAWANPHAEVWLRVAPTLAVPADLKSRAVPKQSSEVDGAGLLAKATVPRRKDALWEIELAPLSRMNAWQVPEIKAGQSLAVVGFTFTDEKGSATVRAEYLFLEGMVFGLRSSPA